ncbi:ATP-binding cassette domain-containing protein [Streptomyces sp. NPDC088757]|uniref:ATP-binding cassette domain-containing protein n=1 Tax=Streptomyces sp. NPDC088757 TaxID=3365889 RepID=UPI0037F511AD
MRGVTRRHGRVEAVADVDPEIAAGDRAALTGTDGSGKTILLRAVLGLHRRAASSILVGGRGARTAAERAWRRRACARVPQKPAAGRFPLLGAELLASSTAPAEATDAAVRLGVGALVGRPLHALSGGQLQRVYLARAIGCPIGTVRSRVARARGDLSALFTKADPASASPGAPGPVRTPVRRRVRRATPS